MNVSKNTFKKYAKMHALYKPITNWKGIRKTGNVGSTLKHDLKQILEGKNPNPYREDTLLKRYTRGIFEVCLFKLFRRFYSYERYDSIATLNT